MTTPNSRPISGPMPLVRHSKSMATGLRSNIVSNASRPDSSYSTKSSTIRPPRETKALAGALKHLNTPLANANDRTANTVRARTASTASNLSNRRVVDEAQEFCPVVEADDDGLPVAIPRKNAQDISKRRAGATISVMGDAILDLINSYHKFLESVADPDGMVIEKVKKTAIAYEGKFNAYLISLETVPDEVKYSIHIIALREEAKDVFHLLKASIGKVTAEDTANLMDRAMCLARQLVEEVRRLMTDLSKPLPTLPEMDEDDDSIDTTSTSSRPSTEEATTPVEETRRVEKSVKIAATNEPDDADWMMRTQPAQTERKPSILRKVRKVKSSNLLGSRVRTVSTSIDSLNAPTLVDCPSHDYREDHSRRSNDTDKTSLAPSGSKAQFTNFPCTTQTTLINDVEYGLHAFKQVPTVHPLNIKKKFPEDSIDYTYAIDGSVKTVAPHCVIPTLVTQQLSPVAEVPGEGYVSTLFSCFQLYSTPENLAKSFLEEYECEKSPIRKMSVALLVRRWLKSFWLDEHKDAIPQLKKLVGKLLVDEMNGNVAQELLNKLQDLLKNEGPSKQQVVIEEAEVPSRFTSIRRPLAVRLQSSPSTPLFEIRADVRALAEQLTLIESEKYLNILPHEVMHRFILREKADSRIVEKVKAQADFSESLMNWAMYMVLVQPTPQKRAKMYSFMIKLAFRCLELRNFSSSHSIYNGLEKIDFNSIKLTKDSLSPKAKAGLELLDDFFYPGKEDSWLKGNGKPCVPVVAGFAGKFGRLCDKPIFVPSTRSKGVHHLNLLLLRQVTRVYYMIKGTRKPYDIKRFKPISEYLMRSICTVPKNLVSFKFSVYDEELKQIKMNIKGPKPKTTCEELLAGSKYRYNA